jgi:hypothetical protein
MSNMVVFGAGIVIKSMQVKINYSVCSLMPKFVSQSSNLQPSEENFLSIE